MNSSLQAFIKELLELGRAAAPTAEQLRAHFSRDRTIAFAGPDLAMPSWAWSVGSADEAFIDIGGDVIGVQISDDPRGWGASAELAVARGTLADVEAITGPLESMPRASGDFRPEESVMAFVAVGEHRYPVTVEHEGGAVKRVEVHFEKPLPPRS